MPQFKIFFRGDSRSPDVIFKEGFQPRVSHSDASFEIKNFCSGPDSVAVSELFEAAADFPMMGAEGEKTQTMVYIVAIDVEQDEKHYFNLRDEALTQAQEDDALILNVIEKASEHIVKNIHHSHVLGAFPIERLRKHPEEIKKLETFTHFKIMGSVIENQVALPFLEKHPRLAKAYKKEIAKYSALIGNEIANKFFVEKLLGDAVYHSVIFSKNKFKCDLTEIKKHIIPARIKANPKFFEASSHIASSKIIITKLQINKLNRLYYQHVKTKRVSEHERKELAECLDKSSVKFINGSPPDYFEKTKERVTEAIKTHPERIKEFDDMPLTKAKFGL